MKGDGFRVSCPLARAQQRCAEERPARSNLYRIRWRIRLKRVLSTRMIHETRRESTAVASKGERLRLGFGIGGGEADSVWVGFLSAKDFFFAIFFTQDMDGGIRYELMSTFGFTRGLEKTGRMGDFTKPQYIGVT